MISQVEKTALVQVLEKKELTLYDLQQLLTFIFNAFKKTEENPNRGYGLFNPVSKTINEDIQSAVEQVQGLSKRLVELITNITQQQTAAYTDVENIWNNLWQDYKSKYQRAEAEIKELPKIEFPEVRLPYNWKELLEMTDRLATRTPEQRAVFYELVERYNGQPKQETTV